jgi:hypothetical protein
MKKITITMLLALFTFLSGTSHIFAQNTGAAESYFIGKWEIKVIGSPMGDMTMPMVFEMKNDSITGSMTDPSGALTPFTSVVVTDTVLVARLSAEGMEIPFKLIKKDDNTVTGNVMDGMAQIEGTRKKE